ncbi:MAG: ribbon-helix-helix protein, CopG family [Acidimicrobiia bacterium]|nr:ribbon-helix-helix protein, CopG family [Acidimicrobiia bacterium]
MRTTFTLDPDVAAELDRIRRAEGLGISEAVNRLIRRGLAAPSPRRVFTLRSAPIGLRVDVTDIGAVLDLLDGA